MASNERDEKPVDRRRFFRAGLRELLKPLAGAVEPLESALKHISHFENPPGPAPGHPHWLRPPGALPERRFLDVCSRCGVCVDVCPAKCIHIDPTGNAGAGAPYIDPDAMPCVVCDGLVCMRGCPTQALMPTALTLIDMGTARWNPATCVRSRGEDCTICIDRCPIGSMAIELRDGKVTVHERGCIGCGVCQHDCPTSPKSIVVEPKSARPAGR